MTRAVVIGAGAAGLGAATELQRAGAEVVVLERTEAVGASWRGRYDRLRLNTVRWMSGLPGRPIPRRLGRWVARDDYVAYLEDCAREAALHVRTGVEARRIDPAGSGWAVETDAGTLEADVVVVATGYDHTPVLPEWPGAASFPGEIVHAADYRAPAPYRGRDVLVAGTGSTGLEIAADLAEGGARAVWVAQRTAPTFFTRAWLGIPLTPLAVADRFLPPALGDQVGWGVQRLMHGDLRPYGMPRPEVGMSTRLREQGRGPVIVDGFTEALRAGRVTVVGALEGFEGGEAVLAGGARLRPDAVIAATGYRRGLEPLAGHLGVLDEAGRPRAVAAPGHAGLFFIGYRVPLSGQLFEIARDARRIARAVRGPRPRRLPGARGHRVVSAQAHEPSAIAAVTAIARASFGVEPPAGRPLFGGRAVDAVDVVLDPRDRPVAFTAYRRASFGGARCVFFDGTATVPDAQRGGLITAAQRRILLRELLRRPWRPVHHVIRTRSPVAYLHSERTFGRDGCHPRRDGAPPPAEVRRIAGAVAEWLGQADALDPFTLRLRGAYDGLGELYGDGRAPRAKDADVDAFLDARLAPGDALIVIGRLDLHTALRHLAGAGSPESGATRPPVQDRLRVRGAAPG